RATSLLERVISLFLIYCIACIFLIFSRVFLSTMLAGIFPVYLFRTVTHCLGVTPSLAPEVLGLLYSNILYNNTKLFGSNKYSLLNKLYLIDLRYYINDYGSSLFPRSY